MVEGRMVLKTTSIKKNIAKKETLPRINPLLTSILFSYPDDINLLFAYLENANLRSVILFGLTTRDYRIKLT